jgi:hypothetical protein
MFLGHVVNVEGSYLDPKKITIVENFPVPRTITSVKAFLGLIGYYCKFTWIHKNCKTSLWFDQEGMQICMDTHLLRGVCNFEEMFDNISNFNQLDQISHSHLF